MATRILYNPTRLHEINYAKLRLLAPGIIAHPPVTAVIKHNGCLLTLSILEQCKYTTTVQLVISNPHNIDTWIPSLEFKIRAYHDAEVAEVLAFEKHSRLEPKYPYPNQHMYQPDEKRQINRFLSDSLGFCIKTGLRFAESWDPQPAPSHGE